MGRSRHLYLVGLPGGIHRPVFAMLTRTPNRIVRRFPTFDAFVAEADELPPGCIVAHGPSDMAGPAALDRIGARHATLAMLITAPLSFTEADALVRMNARALFAPDITADPLIAAITDGLDAIDAADQVINEQALARARIAMLSQRQREIVRAIAAGESSKGIARALGLSPRTVEVHRANILRRTGLGNQAALLRAVVLAEPSGLTAG